MAETPAPQRCCGEIDLSKMGRCGYCVALATVLAALSWGALFFVRQKFPSTWLQAATIVLASLFSLLLLAHVLAFFVRPKKG